MEILNCPRCKVDRPKVSDQGASILLNGMCFSCLVQPAVAKARELEREAGYRLGACPECSPRRNPDCGTCGGHGVVEVPFI